MGFMRLGTRVAVINDQNEILLSKRGDFGVWALPGGRVDSGELLPDSAVREVQEETGLQVEITRAVGLYFQQGRSRTNVLYVAKPIGGELYKSTDETLDNRFFRHDALPDARFGDFYIQHAFDDVVHLYTVETSAWDLLKIDLKLRWRWIQNLLAGRPEPSFVVFDIWVVGIVMTDAGDVVTIMRVQSNGQKALPALLTQTGIYDWAWQGLWQDTGNDKLEFIFVARTFGGVSHPISDLDRHDTMLLRHIQTHAPVWTFGDDANG